MVPTTVALDFPALATCDQLLADETPNLLRLYLNPWVAQTCLCLDYYAQRLAFFPTPSPEDCPSFLANSVEEALSGAIKLARFTVNSRRRPGRSSTVILVDPHQRFPHFGNSQRIDGSSAEFVPGIVRCSEDDVAEILARYPHAAVVVLADGSQRIADQEKLRARWLDADVITIRCLDTRCVPSSCSEQPAPQADILVFDESFVDHNVAFAAFTARHSLFAPWQNGNMSMFHSTTFQPNSLTTRHFMDLLQRRDPATVHRLQDELQRIETDKATCHDIYRRLYSPSLSKLIALTGFDQGDVRAAGHFISISDPQDEQPLTGQTRCRRILDGVAGVACSLRGHNPNGFVQDVRETLESCDDLHQGTADLLHQLTNLPYHVPAVSGASAVEQALQIALSVNPQRPHVLALEGGFGGKTLGALTGTAKPRYKQNLGPLYRHVTYINPFAATAVEDIQAAVKKYPVGVVQTELIQGVGGVRCIPEPVLNVIQQARDIHQFVLFVDEVQTGMFRTGPFLRSQDVGVRPDIVTIGKGTSDTMFPFAITLYNDRIHKQLQQRNPGLEAWLTRRHYSAPAYAALLNTLRRALSEDWTSQVRHQSNLFQERLHDELSGCLNVADIRVFGMLIGIELNLHRWSARLIRKQLGKLYSLAMLHHPQNPLLIGFCQYEPHIFKLTPGLLMNDQLILSVCQTIGESLNRSPLNVAIRGLRTIRGSRSNR